MTPVSIVKAFNVQKDVAAGLLLGRPKQVALAIGQFGFQCAPSALHYRIIIAVARATDTSGDPLLGEQGLIGQTGILRLPRSE